MQIGQLNHLNYPNLGNQAANGAAAGDAGSAAGTSAKSSGRSAAAATAAPVQDAVGVILKLQADISAQPSVALQKDLVYSDGRQRTTAPDADADTRRMAEQHRLALERTAGTSTPLVVDKDGVLVTQAAASANAAAEDSASTDFVTFAVKTMRDYADEQARLKPQAAAGEGTGSLIPHSLADIQKLAARFKLFV